MITVRVRAKSPADAPAFPAAGATCGLLDRCDKFITHEMRTYLTSNFTRRSAQLSPELETLYGDWLHSRLHEMCNLVNFPTMSLDRRAVKLQCACCPIKNGDKTYVASASGSDSWKFITRHSLPTG